MLDSGLEILKKILPYYGIGFNNRIGYEYDILKNQLLLPPSEISDLKQMGISHHRADKLLRLECFSIKNELSSTLDWFSSVDELSKFVIIALAKTTSVSKILSQKQMLTYLQEGRFTAAAFELEKTNADRRLITILKTGKVR